MFLLHYTSEYRADSSESGRHITTIQRDIVVSTAVSKEKIEL